MEFLTEAQRALFAHGGCLADYDVLKPIGKGKFSVVYKAQRCHDGVAVALKKIAIFDLMDARAREKTLKEVRLVQSVSHENLVQYLDAFLDGKELYIAFEWADAGDLKRQIRKANERQVRLDERTIWRYFSQLCAAIRYLHRARIMHRDLKPANILLTTKGIVKVGDLGLGRHLSEDTLEAHSKVGTPLYMSPEVLKGEGYDWKSDVWSLGCILYELAMLRSPFKSEGLNLYGLFQKINKCDYEPIPEIYSTHLRTLVSTMISLEATRRPSIDEVWEACQLHPQTIDLHQRAQPTTQSTSSPRIVQSTISSPPSSQQSDDKNSNSFSSSRPTSSEKTLARSHRNDKTDEEVAKRHEEMAMELLYERLKILEADCGVNLRSGISRHHFGSESQYVEPWTQSPSYRFQEMCRVARWLTEVIQHALGSSNQQLQFGEADQQPIARVQLLLLAAEKVGVDPKELVRFNAATLTSGCGLDVVLFLQVLSERADEALRNTRPHPTYPREIVDVLEADDNWEALSDDMDAASGGDSTKSVSRESVASDDDCEFVDARWLIVRESERPPTFSAGEQQEMIHSTIDAAAWRSEVGRVQQKLSVRCRASADEASASFGTGWAQRLVSLRKHCAIINDNQIPVVTGLSKIENIRRNGCEILANKESRLQQQFDYIGTQRAASATRLQQLQKLAKDLARSVEGNVEMLSSVETRLEFRVRELERANVRVTDATPLLQLKSQLQRLKEENHALQLQIELGCVRNFRNHFTQLKDEQF